MIYMFFSPNNPDVLPSLQLVKALRAKAHLSRSLTPHLNAGLTNAKHMALAILSVALA